MSTATRPAATPVPPARVDKARPRTPKNSNGTADTASGEYAWRFDLDEKAIEHQARKIGAVLMKRSAQSAPAIWTTEGMQCAMMGLLMRDEDLRYRILRFVDVYPALRTGEAVSEHFLEYLTSPALITGLKPTHLSDVAVTAAKIGRRVPGVTRWASRLAVRKMALQFIAGDTPESVAVTVRSMENSGFMFSLDLLGEFVASEKQAEGFARRYQEMIEGFGRILGTRHDSALPKAARSCGPRVNVSIKLSSLTSKFEPADPEGTSAAVRERLRPLFRAAKKSGAFINVDMEKFSYRDLSIRILQDLLLEPEFKGYENIGTVAQAYLRDADTCLVKLLDWLEANNQPMTIRLVKGAYWDSEQLWARQLGWPEPVILVKRETDAMYERCTRILLERHQVVRTAIASHNLRSIAHALALAKALGVPTGRYECQMLFGMAGSTKDALRSLGIPVRIYTPCGDLIQGMAYLVRRILENTSNESFLRMRFSDGVSSERLLADPKPAPPRGER
jgi:RHH-type proline utilization regulon transcriptional repressor/proline dehydrogenase/delta 1-pyrroline-5-carboxylate dehydrogenase